MAARRKDQPSILVMGEALVDVVTRDDGVDEHVGGSPANVAFGLGRLGHDIALATWIGDDRRGKRIARTCRRAGVKLVPGSNRAPRTSVANAEDRRMWARHLSLRPDMGVADRTQHRRFRSCARRRHRVDPRTGRFASGRCAQGQSRRAEPPCPITPMLGPL